MNGAPWTDEDERLLTLARLADVPWDDMPKWLPARTVEACMTHWTVMADRAAEKSAPNDVQSTRFYFDGVDGSRRLLRRQLETGQHFFQANRDEAEFVAACDLVGLRMVVKREEAVRQAA